MNIMIPPRLKRPFVFLLPVSLIVLCLFFIFGYISPGLFTDILLILLALVLMGVTVRLVLERDRRVDDQEKKRRGSMAKK